MTCALAPEDAPIWVDYGRVALDAERTSEAKLAFEQATLRAESENELRYRTKLSLGHAPRRSPALRGGVAIAKADSKNAGYSGTFRNR